MIIVEHDNTGRILSVVTYPVSDEYVIGLYPQGLFLPVGAEVSQSLDYVENGELQRRPVQDITLSGNILRGVPAGATLRVEGESHLADGTDVELQFSHPGTYKIQVIQWPYIDWEVVYEDKVSA